MRKLAAVILLIFYQIRTPQGTLRKCSKLRKYVTYNFGACLARVPLPKAEVFGVGVEAYDVLGGVGAWLEPGGVS